MANRRLQTLGHLTAARKLSIRQALSYGNTARQEVVPEIVHARSQNRHGASTLNTCGAQIRKHRVFSPTTMPAIDWRTLLYLHEPASTSLASRAMQTRSANAEPSRERASCRHRRNEPRLISQELVHRSTLAVWYHRRALSRSVVRPHVKAECRGSTDECPVWPHIKVDAFGWPTNCDGQR